MLIGIRNLYLFNYGRYHRFHRPGDMYFHRPDEFRKPRPPHDRYF